MLIPGHVGFTVAIATLIQKNLKLEPLKWRQLLVFAVLAVLPDILDKTLHRLYPPYLDHLIFHSLVLYALALLVLWIIKSRLLIYVAVMAFHPVLDLVNADPRALLYPLFGWRGWTNPENPPETPGPLGLPALFPTSHLRSHLWVYEVIGALLVVWAIRASAKPRNKPGPSKQVI